MPNGKTKDLNIAAPNADTEYPSGAPGYFHEIKNVIKNNAAVTEITADITLDETHNIVNVASLSTVQITLPAASSVASAETTKEYSIFNKGVFDESRYATFPGGGGTAIAYTGAGAAFSIGDIVSFGSFGTLPASISVGTNYYVKAVSPNSFTISATPGGSEIIFATQGVAGEGLTGGNSHYVFDEAGYVSGTVAIIGKIRTLGAMRVNPILPVGTLIKIWSDGTGWFGADVSMRATVGLDIATSDYRQISSTPAPNVIPVADEGGSLAAWIGNPGFVYDSVAAGWVAFDETQHSKFVTFTQNGTSISLVGASSMLTVGMPVFFNTWGTLPTILESLTTYYVKEVTSDTFKIAATINGDAITINSQGATAEGLTINNTHYVSRIVQVTIPVGVTTAWIFAKAGGGGGSGYNGTDTYKIGGGEGGKVSWHLMPVSPGDIISAKIGRGGHGYVFTQFGLNYPNEGHPTYIYKNSIATVVMSGAGGGLTNNQGALTTPAKEQWFSVGLAAPSAAGNNIAGGGSYGGTSLQDATVNTGCGGGPGTTVKGGNGSGGYFHIAWF
jgi:hypothetical protein